MTAFTRSERVLVLVPALATLFTFAWAALRARHLSGVENERSVAMIPASSGAISVDLPASENFLWPEPVAQAKGAEWIFDLFTPPDIYYDARTRQFSITLATAPPAATSRPTEVFGVRLVDVHRAEFRLQLVGYVGSGTEAAGMFENVATTEHFLARAGFRAAELGILIKEFDVRRLPADLDGGVSLGERVAVAAVEDERSGKTEQLTTRKRNARGDWIATFAPSGAADARFEARAGESFSDAAATYTVVRINPSPLSVEVTKTPVGSGGKETQALTLR